ncbi:hypothetical protein [Gandjariella thermophila]|nr:hypothetical protein [Gandjariella thermophila]
MTAGTDARSVLKRGMDGVAGIAVDIVAQPRTSGARDNTPA